MYYLRVINYSFNHVNSFWLTNRLRDSLEHVLFQNCTYTKQKKTLGKAYLHCFSSEVSAWRHVTIPTTATIKTAVVGDNAYRGLSTTTRTLLCLLDKD